MNEHTYSNDLFLSISLPGITDNEQKTIIMEPLSMQEIQAVSLNILKKIHEICEQEHLRYVLAFGTLIGAVRHKGYIPWDDDVDIMMPRPDYERLMAYFEEHKEDMAPYMPMNMTNTPDYPHMITRICDTDYRIVVEDEKKCGLGVFVDVYVYDGCGKTLEEGHDIMRKTMRYPSLIFLSTRSYLHIGNTVSKFRMLVKPFAYFYTKVMGTKYFVRKLMRMVDKTNFDNCEYCACLEWNTNPLSDVRSKKIFEERILTDFEGYRFYIPKNYDKELTREYGDYMTPPPINRRKYHHLYMAYKK